MLNRPTVKGGNLTEQAGELWPPLQIKELKYFRLIILLWIQMYSVGYL